MAKITEINDFSAPELDMFVRLTGAQLRNKLEPEREYSLPKVQRS